MSGVTVQNLSDFIRIVSSLKSKPRNIGLLDDNVLLFRGQSNSAFVLEPSLSRNRKTAVDISIFDEERNLLELAKFKLPEIFRGNMLPLELLALAQHYGIPTRLLDVTENALVALYFACSNNTDADGKVFVFNNKESDVANYPIVEAIADSYRLVRGTVCDLKYFFNSAKIQPYFAEHFNMVSVCFESDTSAKEKLDATEWIQEVCKRPIFVYAPVRTLRQQIQQGRYILFPNKIICSDDDKKLLSFEAQIDPIPEDDACISQIITIPSSTKSLILEDLETCGIRRDTLFADSIDDVCAEIKNACIRRTQLNPRVLI